METLNIQQAIELIEDTIINDRKHEHYKRVVEVAKIARQVMTGRDHDDILKRYKSRETEDMIKQRVRLYESPTQGIMSPISSMFDKLRFLKNDTKKNWTDPGGRKSLLLRNAEKEPWQDQDLQDYLFDVLQYYTFHDPNAVLYIAQNRVLNQTEGRVDDVKIYPLEITSDQAINYKITRGRLDWLIYEIKREEVTAKGYKYKVSDYYFTGPGIELVYLEYIEQLPADKIPIVEPINFKDLAKGKGSKPRKFVVLEYPNTGTVETPAFIMGTYLDAVTNNSTYVTCYWNAMPLVFESIRDKSFQDCQIPEHYYPRQFHLAPKCNHVDEEHGPCLDGYTGNVKCKACGGKAHNLHISEQDRVILALPESGIDLPDLSKLIYWHLPPEWMPKWMDERLTELRRRVFFEVFNSEPLEKPIGTTATEVNVNYENVQQRIAPYAQMFSDCYRKYMRVAAQYVEAWNPDFEIMHSFPADLKLESIKELMDMLERAKTTGASYPTIQALQDKIMAKSRADDPDGVRLYQAFQYHVPWKDKSESQVVGIINRRDPSDFEAFLWENQDQVFNRVQEQAPLFADFPKIAQKQLVQRIVGEMQLEVTYTQGPDDPFGERITDQSPEGGDDEDEFQNGEE
jgi:hypothetical protein